MNKGNGTIDQRSSNQLLAWPDGDMLDTLSIVIADITAMIGLVCVGVANGGAGGFVVSLHGVFIYTAY